MQRAAASICARPSPSWGHAMACPQPLRVTRRGSGSSPGTAALTSTRPPYTARASGFVRAPITRRVRVLCVPCLCRSNNLQSYNYMYMWRGALPVEAMRYRLRYKLSRTGRFSRGNSCSAQSTRAAAACMATRAKHDQQNASALAAGSRRLRREQPPVCVCDHRHVDTLAGDA